MAELWEEDQRTRESLGQALTDVKQLRSDVRRIDGRLDRGFETNYEAKVAHNVRSILGQQAGVRNSRVLKGPSLRTDPDFDREVESAEASGTITEDESDELLLLDVIVSGNRTGTQDRVYAGIEVSITANDDDVNRAADRTEILRKVTRGPVMAAVIAARMEAPQRELAARREVAGMHHPCEIHPCNLVPATTRPVLERLFNTGLVICTKNRPQIPSNRAAVWKARYPGSRPT